MDRISTSIRLVTNREDGIDIGERGGGGVVRSGVGLTRGKSKNLYGNRE